MGLEVLVVCSAMPEAQPSWEVDGVPYAALYPLAADGALRSMLPGAQLS
ncbi:hypothetical protein ACFXKX_39425 [Streptomyces scopuliridis]